MKANPGVQPGAIAFAPALAIVPPQIGAECPPKWAQAPEGE
jgi:hypothetical protein